MPEPTLEEALNAPGLDGVRQVVLIDAMWDGFVKDIYDRGLRIFRIPDTDPDAIPTYGVGPSQETWESVLGR